MYCSHLNKVGTRRQLRPPLFLFVGCSTLGRVLRFVLIAIDTCRGGRAAPSSSLVLQISNSWCKIQARRALCLTHAPCVTTVLLPRPCGCATCPAGARASVYAATDPNAVRASASTDHYLDANAHPAQPSRAVADQKLAVWLWQWSKEQVQLPPSWEPSRQQSPAGAASK